MILKIILFEIFILHLVKGNKKSVDEDIGSKYQFHLFENFDGNADVYRHETKIVQRLKARKLQCEKKMENIS